MQLDIKKENLIKKLNYVVNAIDKKHANLILANVLIQAKHGILCLTGSDLEIEITTTINLATIAVEGEVTVNAKKFLDIIKNLPNETTISLNEQQEKNQLLIKTNHSKFVLAILDAKDYPYIEGWSPICSLTLSQSTLKTAIDDCAFAMANNDARYYLNGLLFEITAQNINLVATDGHRLAISNFTNNLSNLDNLQTIFSRKSVIELNKILTHTDQEVKLQIGKNYIKAQINEEINFIAKLVEGNFPDYAKVIPSETKVKLELDKQEFKNTLLRVSILSNEKYRGVKLVLKNDDLLICANNSSDERAEETLKINPTYTEMEIGFNVSYLLDVINVIKGNKICIELKDENTSALINNKNTQNDNTNKYIIMPMRI